MTAASASIAAGLREERVKAHVNPFPQQDYELIHFAPDIHPDDVLPNRADALVSAPAELMFVPAAEPRIRKD